MFEQKARYLAASAPLSTAGTITSNALGDNSSQSPASITSKASSGAVGSTDKTPSQSADGQNPVSGMLTFSSPLKLLSSPVPAFFELCVNRSKTQISLGEIQLVDALGQERVKSDMELFGEETIKRATMIVNNVL